MRQRRLVAALAVTVSMATALAVVPPALAEPDDFPSRRDVEAAEAEVAQRAGDVAEIKARLALANQRLMRTATEAEHASEAYNGAMWELQQATDALREARADAARARRTVAVQRDRIGELVAASYQQAGELSALSAMAGADGPEGVLDQYVAFQGAATSMEADYARFAATDSLARVFARKAAAAKAEQERVAARAEEARERAAAAAEAAQVAAEEIAAEKDRLIRSLAEAQDISVDLARKRQTALEEIARQRAAQRARREALAAARAEAEAQARAEREAARKAAARKAAQAAAAAADRKEPKQDEPRDRPRPKPRPEPAPAPSPQPAPAPAPASGAQQAISFARAQTGEPYQWGAAGPDAWDCSGLTMKAWEAGGVSLPHYSVAQYYAGTPISASALRPGDLVFWSSSSSPEGIHHVALYIGDGMIVHAPRTGRDVSVESMYYWVPPTHFARV
ncbi:MAG TPA: C40 family peptidase [Gemmatimonadales bacterium]|nr:C40 family peptidase [Gemmatimonadales bacterium]